MLDFSHYDFDTYVVWANTDTEYFQDSPWGRRMVDLKDVTKNGIEMEINGNLTERLFASIGFAYVDWNYHGPKGGIEEMSADSLSNRAKYRANTSIIYDLTDRLQLQMDYRYQDQQENEIVDVIDEEAGEIDVRTVKTDSYGVMDVSASYILFDRWKRVQAPTLKVFINNALDEDYENTRGYPAPERTYGAELSLTF